MKNKIKTHQPVSNARKVIGQKLKKEQEFQRSFLKSLISKIEWRKVGAAEKGEYNNHTIVVSRFKREGAGVLSLKCFAWRIVDKYGEVMFESGFEKGASTTSMTAKLKAVKHLDYFVLQKDKSVSIEYLSINQWPDKKESV